MLSLSACGLMSGSSSGNARSLERTFKKEDGTSGTCSESDVVTVVNRKPVAQTKKTYNTCDGKATLSAAVSAVTHNPPSENESGVTFSMAMMAGNGVLKIMEASICITS